jgi:hypothetical protein
MAVTVSESGGAVVWKKCGREPLQRPERNQRMHRFKHFKYTTGKKLVWH